MPACKKSASPEYQDANRIITHLFNLLNQLHTESSTTATVEKLMRRARNQPVPKARAELLDATYELVIDRLTNNFRRTNGTMR